MRPPKDPDVLSQALADPSRRALLENLRFGQKTVTQLVAATGLKQPNVSNHLAKMRQQDIVRAERIGRQVHYSLSTPFADVLMQMHEMAADSRGATAADLPSQLNSPEAQGAGHPSGGDAWVPAPYDAQHPVPKWHEPNNEGAVSAAAFVEQCRSAYFHAVMAGDEERTIAMVNSLVAQRFSMETIYTEVFAASLNYIGELYRRGVTDEAHEHLASAITERMMARVAQFHMPVARLAYRALLGCVADNWHALGLRMLADGLKAMGWEAIYLGANVPTVSFVSMTNLIKPDLVVISCSMQDQFQTLRDLLTQLATLRGQAEEHSWQIAVGGHYFLENADEMEKLPIDFTASDMHQFLSQVRENFTPAV